ncbi:LIM domain-containing protein [Xylariales sp. AK1849]|nr:LIM domain-containing protein [Xylariales sp. AK1849]
MAGSLRESAFMPAIKCSQCGNEIEISKMGEHICSGSFAAEPAPPPPDVLGGAFASLKQTVWGFGSRAAPPAVDTSAANHAFARTDDLTPVSASTGSRTISPRTPTGRLGAEPNSNDYFSPAIADMTSPGRNGRPGGYGGLGEPQSYEPETMYGGYSSSPQKQPQAAPSVLQRMNTIAPGPFEMSRRAKAKNDRAITPESNADEAARNGYGIQRPSTAASYSSNNSGSMAPPRVPRKNGYGGFGPPQRDQDDEFEPRPMNATQRSETFPKQSQNMFTEVPARAPSAPGTRPDRLRRPTNENTERPVMNQDREKRPSFGMRDTSKPPPPRKSLVRPPTAGRDSPSINLADEFGVGNPYHAPSVSQSSSNSGYSQMSQPSQPSSNSSPARSMGSRRTPSDTSNIDALMNDLQSSMDSLKPKELLSAPKPTPMDNDTRFSDRRARPDDSRYDPAVQGGRASRPRSPLASPPLTEMSSRIDPAIQSSRSRDPPPQGHNRKPSLGRSRGDCKACKLPITGKSISSADGRLSGRYHKACFVCTTCQNPFTSSTFYVLDDKPYDGECYHRLNGSCCGTCGNGIEGQYLEDESMSKHHPGCFCCGDCGQVLRDGYFEVNGKAYCERDAWRRIQQSAVTKGPGRGGMKPQTNGRPFGLPSGNRLGPPGLRPRMEKRMTRLGMM